MLLLQGKTNNMIENGNFHNFEEKYIYFSHLAKLCFMFSTKVESNLKKRESERKGERAGCMIKINGARRIKSRVGQDFKID